MSTRECTPYCHQTPCFLLHLLLHVFSCFWTELSWYRTGVEDAYKVLFYLFASLSGALLWSKASCCLMFAVDAQTLCCVVYMTQLWPETFRCND